MILLRCICRQAASRNGAGQWGNWKARSPSCVGSGNWKARSPNFVGSPMCTVSHGSPMSTGISSAAAPWLMLPPSFEDGGKTMSFNFYSPVDKKVTRVSNKSSSIGGEELELVGSSHGWLALYEKGKPNFDLFLYNPISGRQIKLPPVEAIPAVQEEKLKFSWRRPDKVILSCPPPNEEEESMEDSSNSCRAILRYGPRNNMAVCCPGLSTEWTPFGAPFHEKEGLNEFLGQASIVRRYEDFVYSTRQKQLFCVTEYDDFEAWDIGDPLRPKLNWKQSDDDMEYDEENYPWHARSDQEAVLKDSCPEFTYLVFSEHSNQLFLVHRYFMESKPPQRDVPFKTVGFDVYEIIIKGRGGGELRYMDGNLNGMAFFVGGSEAHGFVVESPGTINLLPNSIYYTDPKEVRTPSFWNKYGGHDLVIFNYANGTFSPHHHLPCGDTPKDPVPTPMWFTPSPSIRSLQY